MRRLSLAEAAERVAPLAPSVRSTVEQIPGARLDAWDCVVFELRPERADVMASFRAPRPELPTADPLSPARTRSWHADLGEFPLLWYEWDCPLGRPQPPLESICVSPSILGGERPSFRRALEVLGARDWGPGIERLVTWLGHGGELLHLAPLLPRGLDRLRLTFHVVASAIIPWLQAAGWPGAPRTLESTLARLAMPQQRLGVQLELDEGGLGAYLGIETREFRSTQNAHYWMKPLLEQLSRCAPLPAELREALPRWPGEVDGLLQHAYTKLVHQEGEWSAKAYLGMTTPAVAADMLRLSARRRTPSAAAPPRPV